MTRRKSDMFKISFRTLYFVLSIMLILLLLGGCGGEKIKAPFFDGLYLIYKGSTADLNMSYEFHLLKDGEYDVLYTGKTKFGGPRTKHLKVN
jgi:hypothetical protein